MALYNTSWSDIASPLAGTERFEVDAGQTAKAFATSLQIAQLANGQVQSSYAANTATTAATLNAANITKGTVFSVIDMTGTLGASVALTLPTVAAVVTALGSRFVVGMSWTLRIINDSGATFSWTLTTNTGWGTLGGTQSIAQDTFRDFVLTLTSATAGTVQSVGTGTNS